MTTTTDLSGETLLSGETVWQPGAAPTKARGPKSRGEAVRSGAAPRRERSRPEPATPRWDERAARRLVQTTLARLAGLFPSDYDHAADAHRWDRLEAAVNRAIRLQSWPAVERAVESFEGEIAELFRQHRTADLPPAGVQLELWFESLPE